MQADMPNSGTCKGLGFHFNLCIASHSSQQRKSLVGKKVQTNKDRHKQLEVQNIQIKTNNALIETHFTGEIVLRQTHSNIEFTSFPWHVTMELFHWFNT